LVVAGLFTSPALADLNPADFSQLKSSCEMHGNQYAGLFSLPGITANRFTIGGFAGTSLFRRNRLTP
jgi:hypothetical protein